MRNVFKGVFLLFQSYEVC